MVGYFRMVIALSGVTLSWFVEGELIEVTLNELLNILRSHSAASSVRRVSCASLRETLQRFRVDACVQANQDDLLCANRVN
jgi:hypothetical protein